VIRITLGEIDTAALRRFSKIYAIAADGICPVWDSHRMLPWTDPSLPAPLIEEGGVDVEGLGSNNIEPIKARITEAGGTRGILL